MTALVVGMLVCLALAVAVVLMVAVPARREGRDVLTARGEGIVDSMRTVADEARLRLDRSGDDEAEGAERSASGAGARHREPAGQHR